MYILLYIFLGFMLYYVGSFILFVISVHKLTTFFEEYPNGLPAKLPKHVQESKDLMGEDGFNDFYKRCQDRNM